MILTFRHFLIVCPLVFAGGFVDAMAGGGGLITLPAYLIAELPAHTAIGTNKLSSCMGTATSTLRFARAGYIPLKIALCSAAFALCGSALGARLALLLDDRAFKILMLFIVPLTELLLLRGRALREDLPPYPFGKTLAICICAAFLLGAYDGFYGPGTGTFLMLLLTGAAHMSVRTANGVTKAINFSTNIAALAVYLVNGRVLIPLGLTAGLFSVLGNYLGTRSFQKNGARSVKPVMIAVLLLFFVRIVSDLAG